MAKLILVAARATEALIEGEWGSGLDSIDLGRARPYDVEDAIEALLLAAVEDGMLEEV
jgi:hypothetical protein